MTLTFEDIETEVRRVAALEPGRVAKDTYYNADGIPECIFGVALGNLGYHTELRDIVDGFVQDTGSEPGITEVLDLMDESQAYTTDEMGWLESVQTGNDIKKPWAEAVEYADARNL